MAHGEHKTGSLSKFEASSDSGGIVSGRRVYPAMERTGWAMSDVRGPQHSSGCFSGGNRETDVELHAHHPPGPMGFSAPVARERCLSLPHCLPDLSRSLSPADVS